MPQMTRTVEEITDRTSPIEEVENCSINNIFISSLAREVADSRTDEGSEICEVGFSRLLIDCSKDMNTREEISKEEFKSPIVFNPLRDINQLVTESKFLIKDSCSVDDSMPLEEPQRIAVCDPDMVKKIIQIIDCDNCFGEAVLKKTNGQNKDMTCEKSTQTDEESAPDAVVLKNQSTSYPTNEIESSNLQSPSYLNRPNIAKDVKVFSQLRSTAYEKSDETIEHVEVVEGNICRHNYLDHNQNKQPMDTVQLSHRNASQNSEDVPDRAIEDLYVVFEKIPKLSIVSEIVEYLNKIPDVRNNSSPASETSNRSETRIERSITLEYLDQTEIFRNFCERRKLSEDQLTAVLNFLRNIISIMDNLEFMNKCLTDSFDGIIKLQHSLQELINLVYESLVEFQYIPSPYILIDNEYTEGKVRFNVQLFGEDIFKNLKSMKKELNVLFREFAAFQKNFKYTSGKLSSVPFHLTQDHEIQSTLDKTVRIYSNICRVFKYSERLDFFKNKIGSETLTEVTRAKEFGEYLSILKENPIMKRKVDQKPESYSKRRRSSSSRNKVKIRKERGRSHASDSSDIKDKRMKFRNDLDLLLGAIDEIGWMHDYYTTGIMDQNNELEDILVDVEHVKENLHIMKGVRSYAIPLLGEDGVPYALLNVFNYGMELYFKYERLHKRLCHYMQKYNNLHLKFRELSKALLSLPLEQYIDRRKNSSIEKVLEDARYVCRTSVVDEDTELMFEMLKARHIVLKYYIRKFNFYLDILGETLDK